MRFRFDPDALEVVIGEQEERTENSFVGGENRWKYDTFVNWEVCVQLPCPALSANGCIHCTSQI